MLRRIILSSLAVALSLQGVDAFAQTSGSSSVYLNNRERAVRQATNSSYFINRASTSSIYGRATPRYDNYNYRMQNVFAGVPGARSKPFSGSTPSSGVSPYLGLGGLNVGSVPNYYSIVRPQLEQQRQNERAQQQQIAQQQELVALAARSPYAGAEGQQPMLPTGHVSVFMNYFGYYPQPAPPRR